MTSESTSEHVPLINKAATILALVIAFQFVAWVAVALRLFARFKLVRSAGWDDLWVVLACISVTVGTGFVAALPFFGLGKHVATLALHDYRRYLYCFWSATIAYICSTCLIKISLLVQYLRLLKGSPRLYKICIGLAVFVACWGITFMCCLIFSCTPVDKFWYYSKSGYCFGFGVGSSNPDEFFTSFAVHSASNMALDVIVFTLPLFALSSINMEGRRKYAIAGLAVLGGSVITISIIRLADISYTRAATYPTIDPTYLGSTSIVLSCLEVDVAILCASIPIFWPMLSALGFNKIFVVNEVIVRSEQRLSRSLSSGSQTELRTYHSIDSSALEVQRHYKDPYVIDMVLPLDDRTPNGSRGLKPTHVAEVKRGDIP